MTCNKNGTLQPAITQICNWFRSDYARTSGLPTYQIDGATGRMIGDRDLLPELDDYLPFIWMAGETQYVQEQIGILHQRLKESPLLFSRPEIRRHAGIGLPGFLRRFIPYTDAQDFVEILYGLLELDGLNRNPEWIETAVKLFRSIISAFSRNGHLRSFRVHPFGPVLPVIDAMTGMLIEIGVELYERTGEVLFRDEAVNWCRNWLDTELFQTHGLFASALFTGGWKHVSLLKRFTRRVELAKANTSMAFGLMALCRLPETAHWAMPAMNRWLAGIHTLLSTSDGVFSHIPQWPGMTSNAPILSTNFALIDVFCDLHTTFDRPELLQDACNIANFFIAHQSVETGLFPDEIGVERSYLDANTDLAVALYRLHELTQMPHYLIAGERSIDGVLRYHSAPYGYYRDVHLHTGAPISTLVETRFVSLLLKALLLYRDRPKIYASHQDWARFRDR